MVKFKPIQAPVQVCSMSSTVTEPYVSSTVVKPPISVTNTAIESVKATVSPAESSKGRKVISHRKFLPSTQLSMPLTSSISIYSVDSIDISVPILFIDRGGPPKGPPTL